VFPRQYGDFAARVPELPGCGAVGPTKDAALTNVLAAIDEYRETAGDERVRTNGSSEIEVVDYAGDGFFAEDDEPISSTEAQQLAARFASLVAQLDALTAQLSAELRETRPGSEWSVREIRDHLAEVEVRWLSRLDAAVDGSFRVHDAVHEMVRERLADLSSQRGAGRTVLGSRWTPRRVVRRILEHQFEHREQIIKTIAAARESG
jgi:predicted RNase H-like HicB family nuclease